MFCGTSKSVRPTDITIEWMLSLMYKYAHVQQCNVVLYVPFYKMLSDTTLFWCACSAEAAEKIVYKKRFPSVWPHAPTKERYIYVGGINWSYNILYSWPVDIGIIIITAYDHITSIVAAIVRWKFASQCVPGSRATVYTRHIGRGALVAAVVVEDGKLIN